MSNYTASVRVSDGMLHTSRPLTAPEPVQDLIESVLYAVRDSAGAISEVTVEVGTPEESDTPIADSVGGTSSTPLAPPLGEDDDEDVADVPAPLA